MVEWLHSTTADGDRQTASPRVPARGTAGRVDLPPGTYAVRVESQYYQVAERTDIFLPRPDAAYFFDLEPGFAYPFPSQVWKALR